MNIVFLDAATIGDDIDLERFKDFGTVTMYPYSSLEEARERTRDADIVILNKVPINETSIGLADHLKLVCVTATGTNILDKAYLEKRNIEWRNVAGYSTDSVAQHTFALFFYLYEKLNYYDNYVKSERYIGDTVFSHFAATFHELSGKTWGIIGLGNIGRRVAAIAEAFGCHVIYASASGAPAQDGYTQVSLDELYRTSDIISIHAPLNEYTENLIDLAALRKMKPDCIPSMWGGVRSLWKKIWHWLWTQVSSQAQDLMSCPRSLCRQTIL